MKGWRRFLFNWFSILTHRIAIKRGGIRVSYSMHRMIVLGYFFVPTVCFNFNFKAFE
jgi:hypothetical protein